MSQKLTYYDFSEARKAALKEINKEEQIIAMQKKGTQPSEIARILGMGLEMVKQTMK